MSKITVTTIAGQTSGADADKVKIESGDTLEVASNATVGGNLTVDTNTLAVNSSTNRVGIGTTSPSNQLHVTGSGADVQARVETTSAGHASRLLLHANNYSGGSYNAIQSFQGDAGAAWEISGAKANATNVMRIFTGGTEGIKISSGMVNMPSQPSFQARSNVANINLSTYAGGTHALTSVFNAEYFDIGNNYNTTNSTFTAPVAGRYYFYVQLQLSGSPTTSDHSWGINLHFQVNSGGNHANGYHSLSTSQGGASTLFGAYGLAQKENILNLAANDTVRVALSGNANINAGVIESVTNDGRCRFGGHLLG